MSRLLFIVAVICAPVLAVADAPAGRYTIADSGTVRGTVYDKKTKLTWQQVVPTTLYSWEGARAYCADTASGILGGSGWRLPTLKELLSIVDYSQIDPAIDRTAFPSTPYNSYYYWASSAYAGESSYAWYVSFDNGRAGYDARYHEGYVRCVR